MKNYDIIQIFEDYSVNKITISNIAKNIGVSPQTINYQLKKHGYILENKSHSGNNRIHSIDLDFFNVIDSPNKAYILGLIVSDGYVDNYTKLTFTSKDIELVELFKRELKSEHKLATYHIYDNRTNKEYVRYSIQIASKKIVEDLNKLEIFSNKSFNCKMPKIPEQYFWDFIRGLFDGDGYIGKETKKKEGTLRFSIIGSTNILTSIKHKFESFGLSKTKLEKTKYHSNENYVSRIHYYSYRDLLTIRENMYKNSEGLRLTRKYEMFQTLKEYKYGQYDRTINLRKIKMFAFPSGDYIKTFDNIHLACNEIKVNYEMIQRVTRGERSHTKGFTFKYE